MLPTASLAPSWGRAQIKEKARGSVLAKLAKAKEEVLKHPASGNERRVRKEER